MPGGRRTFGVSLGGAPADARDDAGQFDGGVHHGAFSPPASGPRAGEHVHVELPAVSPMPRRDPGPKREARARREDAREARRAARANRAVARYADASRPSWRPGRLLAPPSPGSSDPSRRDGDEAGEHASSSKKKQKVLIGFAQHLFAVDTVGRRAAEATDAFLVRSNVHRDSNRLPSHRVDITAGRAATKASPPGTPPSPRRRQPVHLPPHFRLSTNPPSARRPSCPRPRVPAACAATRQSQSRTCRSFPPRARALRPTRNVAGEHADACPTPRSSRKSATRPTERTAIPAPLGTPVRFVFVFVVVFDLDLDFVFFPDFFVPPRSRRVHVDERHRPVRTPPPRAAAPPPPPPIVASRSFHAATACTNAVAHFSGGGGHAASGISPPRLR